MDLPRTANVQYVKELKARLPTKPTILLLIYVFAVNTTTVVAMELPQNILSPVRTESCGDVARMTTDSNIRNLFSYCLFLLIPLAGWIGDAKLGRQAAITISLLTGWLGTMLLCISSSVQYILCGGETIHVLFIIAKYVLSTTSLLLLMISVSFCYANVFGYGVRQLLVVGASSVKIRAFIHWVVWIIFASGNTIFMVTNLKTGNPYIGNIVVSLFSFLAFSICSAFHFNFQHWFEKMEIEDNYTLLLGVLRYAWKNKYPENRSSLTYWEEELPNRLDFAKARFGGPYSNENVETVKTFLRILVIIMALVPFLIASDPLVNQMMDFVTQYKGGATELHGQAGNTVWFIGDSIILLTIPILEFVVLPLFPKLEYFLINPLRGIGLSMIFIICSMCGLLIVDYVGHTVTHGDVHCYTRWTAKDTPLKISFWFMLIPSILAGIADMLNYVYVFAFLCSQGPSNMSGMLIGIFWFFRGLCIEISALILIAFEKLSVINSLVGPFSCTFLLMLILGTLAVLGLVVYIFVAKWYTSRIRNEDLNLRQTVEQHFEKRLLSNNNRDRDYFSFTSEGSINNNMKIKN